MNAAGGLPLPGAGLLDPAALYAVYVVILLGFGKITQRVSDRVRIAAEHEFRRETEMYTKCLEQLQKMCAPPVKHHYMNFKLGLVLLMMTIGAAFFLIAARLLVLLFGISSQGVQPRTLAYRIHQWARRGQHNRILYVISRLRAGMAYGFPARVIIGVATVGGLFGLAIGGKLVGM